MFVPDRFIFGGYALQFKRLMVQSIGWIAISNGPLRKGMKYIFVVLAILAVAGCAATSKPVTQSKRGIHINCSGLTSSWAKCYELATNSCASRTFKVIAKSGDATEEPEDYPFGLNPAGYTSRSMIIVCKKPQP